MRTLLAATAIISTLAAGTAFAANTTGTVKTYDMTAMALGLQDGSTYVLPKNFKDPGIKVGEKVKVVWQEMNGAKHAETVTIEK